MLVFICLCSLCRCVFFCPLFSFCLSSLFLPPSSPLCAPPHRLYSVFLSFLSCLSALRALLLLVFFVFFAAVSLSRACRPVPLLAFLALPARLRALLLRQLLTRPCIL
jgi:hypothetical protein